MVLQSDQYTKIAESAVAVGLGTAPNYYGFPGLAQADNGDLITCYMRATDHQTTRDGDIKGKRSTDNGVTWGSEFTIDNGAGDQRDPDLVTLANGDMLCSFTQYLGGTDHEAYVRKSTDDGATWGSRVLITSIFDDWTFVCGRIIELPNGDLLAPYYGQDATDTLDCAGVSKSTDGGATWSGLAEIKNGDAWGRHAQEPVLAYDAELDRVWCAMRSDNGGGNRIYLFYSDDDGATWTTPASPIIAASMSGKPALIVTAEGALALAYRDGADSDKTKLRWSFDKGITWSGAQAVNSTAIYDYASWWNLADGTLGLAWAVEQSSTRGDITFQQMTPPAEVAPRGSTRLGRTSSPLGGPGLSRAGGLSV